MQTFKKQSWVIFCEFFFFFFIYSKIIGLTFHVEHNFVLNLWILGVVGMHVQLFYYTFANNVLYYVHQHIFFPTALKKKTKIKCAKKIIVPNKCNIRVFWFLIFFPLHVKSIEKYQTAPLYSYVLETFSIFQSHLVICVAY